MASPFKKLALQFRSIPKKRKWIYGVTGGAALLLLIKKMAGGSMEPGQVEPVKTKLSINEARAILKEALTKELGRAPTAAELKMMMAQSALETGDWNKMWHWNFGNAVVGRSGANWYRLKHKNPAEDMTHKYRVFDSAAAGATYYVKLVHGRYIKAFDLFSSGDTMAIAAAFKEKGYFEADPVKYAALLDAKLKYV